MAIIWNILAFAICAVLTKAFYNANHSSTLRSIPGPWLAKYTNLWRTFSVARGHAHLDLIALHKKHGHLVRIGPDVVSVSDPAAIPVIYDTSHRFQKTAFFPLQAITWRGKPAMNVFSTRDPHFHRVKKRRVAAAYSMSSILAAEDRVNTCTKLFTEKMRAMKDKPVDLGEWLLHYTSDVVGELTFAKPIGFLESGQDVMGINSGNEFFMGYSSVIGQMPKWHNILLGNPLLAKVAPYMETWNPTLLKTLDAMETAEAEHADDEEDLTNKRGLDMYSRWRKAAKDENSGVSMGEFVVDLSTNLFAGSDTTSIALRSIVYYLCKSPPAMAKVQDEIDRADKQGLLSEPVRYKEATSHLPNFCAVVKESMRLHPSVGLPFERHVPAEGATICDKTFAGGTIVGMNPWVLNRDPASFEEPDAFKPERWLECSAEQLHAQEKILDFNFSAGARSCMGKHMAMVEMHKILPELFRRFDVSLTDPKREWSVTSYFFMHQRGIVCDVKPRAKA